MHDSSQAWAEGAILHGVGNVQIVSHGRPWLATCRKLRSQSEPMTAIFHNSYGSAIYASVVSTCCWVQMRSWRSPSPSAAGESAGGGRGPQIMRRPSQPNCLQQLCTQSKQGCSLLLQSWTQIMIQAASQIPLWLR